MTTKMKNITSYLLAMLIVGLLAFAVLYFIVGASMSDAVFYAIIAATVEYVSKGIVKLYNLVIKKGNSQKSL